MTSKKHYLKAGDKIFSIGALLILDENGKFQVIGFYENNTYFEGQLVNTDDKGYYTEDNDGNTK